MYKAQSNSGLMSIRLYRNYTHNILNLIGSATLLLVSTTSFALAPNPGATCQGITGASQGSLTNADYTSLVSAVNTDNYVNIAGNAVGSIPLQIKIGTTESSSNTDLSNFGVITSSGNSAINVRRTFPNTSAFTEVTFDFRNTITNQPIFLTNVALSAFDVDYANNNSNSFDDFIQITGINEAGNTIASNFQPVTGSNIVFSQSLQGLLIGSTNDPNCPAKNLGTQCQGSVQFSQPVTSVKIRYSNTGYLSTATNQEIDIRVDNYCYVPQYIFSGTIFDDNGGITANQADANNANITSGNYSNKPNYFNGIFNTPQESGITGSTVRLANCSNNATYTTQSVIKNGAPVGAYQISIPKTTLTKTTDLCLIESRTGNTYPIRTNGDRRTIGFSATTYNYPDNNFGRVIAENVALVLRKSQYINDCDATLNYSSINATDSPLAGFSTSTIENIEPGKCVAYKITATNRANMDIDNFVMEDILQKKGTNNAIATSVIASPAPSTTDYAPSSPVLNENGTVTTKPFVLNPRTKRDFYFNTKYGTSQ